MMNSTTFRNKKTGEIATIIPIMTISDWEKVNRYEDNLGNSFYATAADVASAVKAGRDASNFINSLLTN